MSKFIEIVNENNNPLFINVEKILTLKIFSGEVHVTFDQGIERGKMVIKCNPSRFLEKFREAIK